MIKRRAFTTLRTPLLLIVGTCAAFELLDPSSSVECLVNSNVLILLRIPFAALIVLPQGITNPRKKKNKLHRRKKRLLHRQHCRLTICIELVELTNSETAAKIFEEPQLSRNWKCLTFLGELALLYIHNSGGGLGLEFHNWDAGKAFSITFNELLDT